MEREKWPQKPRKDWTLEPPRYAGSPPAPMEAVLKARAAMQPKPNPFAVMNGGLREGDKLVFDWLEDGLQLNGCRVAATRNGTLLHWLPDGWLRDAAGRCLYAPYLDTMVRVTEFAYTLAAATGYKAGAVEEGEQAIQFTLSLCEGVSKRIIPGDHLTFDWQDRFLRVLRRQGTVDMNLYRPEGGGFVLGTKVDYIRLPHHPTVLARLLTEANGLRAQGTGDNNFVVIAG